MASRASLLPACAALLASLSLAAPTHAETSVAGRVIHRAKQTPIPDVSVELLGVRDTVLATGISTHDGAFVLEAPTGGTYRVRLTAPGAEAFVSDSIKVADDEYAAHAFAIDPKPRAFLEIEVERPAVLTSRLTVKYSDDLRSRYVSGCVVVQFVVDTTGRADMSTFRVLKASDPEFAQAVREGLPGLRYRPGELGKRKVRQVMEAPFDLRFRPTRMSRWIRSTIGGPRPSSGPRRYCRRRRRSAPKLISRIRKRTESAASCAERTRRTRCLPDTRRGGNAPRNEFAPPS